MPCVLPQQACNEVIQLKDPHRLHDSLPDPIGATMMVYKSDRAPSLHVRDQRGAMPCTVPPSWSTDPAPAWQRPLVVAG